MGGSRGGRGECDYGARKGAGTVLGSAATGAENMEKLSCAYAASGFCLLGSVAMTAVKEQKSVL